MHLFFDTIPLAAYESLRVEKFESESLMDRGVSLSRTVWQVNGAYSMDILSVAGFALNVYSYLKENVEPDRKSSVPIEQVAQPRQLGHSGEQSQMRYAVAQKSIPVRELLQPNSNQSVSDNRSSSPELTPVDQALLRPKASGERERQKVPQKEAEKSPQEAVKKKRAIGLQHQQLAAEGTFLPQKASGKISSGVNSVGQYYFRRQ